MPCSHEYLKLNALSLDELSCSKCGKRWIDKGIGVYEAKDPKPECYECYVIGQKKCSTHCGEPCKPCQAVGFSGEKCPYERKESVEKCGCEGTTGYCVRHGKGADPVVAYVMDCKPPEPEQKKPCRCGDRSCSINPYHTPNPREEPDGKCKMCGWGPMWMWGGGYAKVQPPDQFLTRKEFSELRVHDVLADKERWMKLRDLIDSFFKNGDPQI